MGRAVGRGTGRRDVGRGEAGPSTQRSSSLVEGVVVEAVFVIVVVVEAKAKVFEALLLCLVQARSAKGRQGRPVGGSNFATADEDGLLLTRKSTSLNLGGERQEE